MESYFRQLLKTHLNVMLATNKLIAVISLKPSKSQGRISKKNPKESKAAELL